MEKNRFEFCKLMGCKDVEIERCKVNKKCDYNYKAFQKWQRIVKEERMKGDSIWKKG